MTSDDQDRDIEAAINRAERLFASGDLEAALTAYLDILCARIDSSPAPPLATMDSDEPLTFVTHRCADLALLCGRASAASKLFEALHLALVESGDRYFADMVAIKRWHIGTSQGDRGTIRAALAEIESSTGPFEAIEFSPTGLDRFESHCERACDWPDDTGSAKATFFASFLLEAGRLHIWLGLFQRAIQALQRCLTHADHAGTEAGDLIAAARLELIAAHLSCGDLEAARSVLDALSSPPKQGIQPWIGIRLAELEAQHAWLSGNLGRACANFEDTRSLCRRYRLPHAQVGATLNLAHCLLLLNRTHDAEIEAMGLMPLCRSPAGASSLGRLNWLLDLIQARRGAGLGGPSPTPSNTALWGRRTPAQRARGARVSPTLDDRSSSPIERLTDYMLEFYQLIEFRLWDEAEQWLEWTTQVFSASDSPLIAARVSLMGAMGLYYRGDFQAADRCLQPVTSLLRDLNLRHDLWIANSVRLWCHARLGVEAAALQEETTALVRRMTCELAPTERALFELNKWSEDESALARTLDGLLVERGRLAALPWYRRWAQKLRWHARLEHLLGELDRRRLAGLDPAAWRRRPRWLRMLRSQAQLNVSFVVLPDRVARISEAGFHFDLDLLPVTRLKVRDSIRQWHERMALHPGDATAALPHAEELGRLLGLPAMLAGLPKIRRLRIIPDDALHGFPFSTLPWNGELVVSRYVVTTDIAHTTQALPRRRPPGARALVVDMGLATPGMAALPGVSGEADAAEMQLRDAGLQVLRLSGLDATVPAVRAALPAARVAHIACHGVFAPEALSQTGMVLAPGLPDGLLDTLDLAELELGGLGHITLTSCWSADNYVLPGRTVVSLPHVLRRAGAGSVLSCLWEVNDSVCCALFHRFYELCGSHSAAESLALVQRELLKKELMPGGYDASDPYYWAGFVVNCSPALAERAQWSRF